jgi:hypothetical protein
MFYRKKPFSKYRPDTEIAAVYSPAHCAQLIRHRKILIQDSGCKKRSKKNTRTVKQFIKIQEHVALKNYYTKAYQELKEESKLSAS